MSRAINCLRTTIFIFILYFMSSNDGYCQREELYHRVVVDLIDRNIEDLSALGIEIDHGIHKPGRSIENDFSEREIDLITRAGFDYTIKINDVVSYYKRSDRASEIDLNDFSRNGCLNSSIQPCTILEYESPTNYYPGSMGGYQTYEEMNQMLDSMLHLFPNVISNKIYFGDSTYMGNRLFYVKISDNPTESEAEPQILYTALHHAREPNGLSQMLYYMWYLLENYGKIDNITNIVNNTELYFVTCVNPDGYLINENNNPQGGGLWRKNAYTLDTILTGVDLNRNYGYFWGFDDNGSSPNPNSATYRGTEAFSEPETKAIKELCEQHQFQIALNYHTFGNLLIHPWGYNDAPTDEDKLFKSMGNDMIHENCYTMGTGTETVGYVVNGDSDDWMYGEQNTKNKIYTFTPEVGPSFWPPATDIETLNKACLGMNIATAQLVTNLYNYEVIGSNFVTHIDTFTIQLFRSGLGEDSIQITIRPISNGINAMPISKKVKLAYGEQDLFKLGYQIEETVGDGEIVEFAVEIRGEGYQNQDEYSFTYYFEKNETSLEDVTELEESWDFTGIWGLNDNEAVSGNFSLSDSPDSRYRRNSDTKATLVYPIALGEFESAVLSFAAKWDIETDYDYAMVMASIDGVDYIPLCGTYTNEGTIDQEEGAPLYDGTQEFWIQEEIPLDDFRGSDSIYIQFRMVSDAFVEGEGIEIDDIRLKKFNERPSGTINTEITPILEVFPNPAQSIIYIRSQHELTNVRIINSVGQVVIQSQNIGDFISIEDLPVGLYFIESTSVENRMRTVFVKE